MSRKFQQLDIRANLTRTCAFFRFSGLVSQKSVSQLTHHRIFFSFFFSTPSLRPPTVLLFSSSSSASVFLHDPILHAVVLPDGDIRHENANHDSWNALRNVHDAPRTRVRRGCCDAAANLFVTSAVSVFRASFLPLTRSYGEAPATRLTRCRVLLTCPVLAQSLVDLRRLKSRAPCVVALPNLLTSVGFPWLYCPRTLKLSVPPALTTRWIRIHQMSRCSLLRRANGDVS